MSAFTREPERLHSVEYLEMRNQALRMEALVNDMLKLARLEGERAAMRDELLQAPALVTRAIEEAKSVSKGQHRFEQEIDRELLLVGGETEFYSIIINLLTNAVRYTPAGGTVSIRFAREADGGAVLAVRDSGYGIPASHLPRITERFYRVSSSRSRESGGTGLGLSIVKHVLGLHQARLDIESEVGKGSEFSCHFGPARVLAREPDTHAT